MRRFCVNAKKTGPGTFRQLRVMNHRIARYRSVLTAWSKLSIYIKVVHLYRGHNSLSTEKSSLLNALEPGFSLPTGEVSERLGRGRHTTRHVELFPLSNGTLIADTPGFAAFEEGTFTPEELPSCFPEFRPFLESCKYSGCSHVKENGCAVLSAIDTGTIAKSRHDSYVRLYNEAKEVQPWQRKKSH